MKIFSNIYKFLAVALASASALASCVQMEDTQENVGYLCFPGLEVDVTVEDLLQTKALNVDVPRPDESTIKYVITDKNGESTEKTGPWEPMKLPVGPYSISATAGTNGFGVPYFAGTYSGTITPLAQETPKLTMNLQNSLVNLSVASALEGHFTLESVKFESAGHEPVTFAATAVPEWYFVPAGALLKVTFSGRNPIGNPAEFTLSYTPAAKVAYNVVCGHENTEGNGNANNLPTITLPEQQAGAWATRLYIDPATVSGNISDDNRAKLVYEVIPEGGDWNNSLTVEQISGDYYVAKGLTNGSRYTVRARIGNLFSEERTVTVKENLEGVTVKSEHYKDGNGDLAGTNSTLSVALPGILGTLNSPEVGLLQITGYSLSNGSETVRTASAAGLMTAESAWPYLPQGSNYVLTINHKLRDESASVPSKNTGFTSPSPKSFMSISLTSYSSYDKYLENNKDAANAMDAFTIKTLGATWTISSDLMNNSNYSKSFTYNNNGQSVNTYSGNACSLGDKTSLAVGTQYKVSASLTFDGEKVDTGAKTHYITGLPYKQEPLVKDDWTSEKNHSGVVDWEYEANCVNIRPNYAWGSAYARVTSNQEFVLPASVNVNVVNDGNKNGRLGVKYFLRFGSTALIDGSEYGNNASIGYNASNVFGEGTYKVQVEATYGAANSTSSYNISKVLVLYGDLPQ